MSLIIDSHCHLESYKKIEIKENWRPITTGYSHSSNIKNAQIGKKHKIPYVLGIAPQTVVKQGILDLDLWIDEIKKHKPNAIGEVGLDLHWAKTQKHIKDERIAFEKMILLATEMKLPLVIHSRKAEAKVIEILREYEWKYGIMMHFFSGNLKQAEKAVDLGALISIPPLHSEERRRIISRLELENLLVETDSPYVVRSFYEVVKAIDYIAEIKKLDKELVIEHTTKNALKFFNIKQESSTYIPEKCAFYPLRGTEETCGSF